MNTTFLFISFLSLLVFLDVGKSIGKAILLIMIVSAAFPMGDSIPNDLPKDISLENKNNIHLQITQKETDLLDYKIRNNLYHSSEKESILKEYQDKRNLLDKLKWKKEHPGSIHPTDSQAKLNNSSNYKL